VQIRPITQPLFRLQWQVQHAAFTHQELIDRMLQYVDSDPVCMRTPDDFATHKVCRANTVAAQFCGCVS